MSDVITKSKLTPARRRLVELAQDIKYGRFEGLPVHGGDPVLDPLPTFLRTFLFGRDNGPNAALSNEDFVLKKNVTEMFEIFDREQSFIIDELVFADGLPVRMTIRGKA